ncbi:MAG: adenosylcobalamin-dependent ribonucleoside-diphosphate reductase, partial [Nitrococcus mobilis]|nr:adenosylcobalamin-dependent ribonucleoside-diphosphate reductase [Nitrococcus mobilis]
PRAWQAGVRLGRGRRARSRSALRSSSPLVRFRLPWARISATRLLFKFRVAGRDLIKHGWELAAAFWGQQPRMVVVDTPPGTPAWDYPIAAFELEAAGEGDGPSRQAHEAQLPEWIVVQPQKHFLPFLAGLIEACGRVSGECGSVAIALSSQALAERLMGLLGLFGVRGVIAPPTRRGRAFQSANGGSAPGGVLLKITDTAFLARVAGYMVAGGTRGRITEHCSQAGQYDHYVLPGELAEALERKGAALNRTERQALGFYHGYHRRAVVSRIWLERWSACFPELGALIAFARTLRPIDAIRRGLEISETFYDFTVEKHSNYLAGENGLMVIHNCGIGYEFSTLRPKGAYVCGAGAYTSGPLSFMDIYDKMCFTVSSAGGRRGAQMATFDVGHPDVLDFIRAKREAGRLRQFNLSLLITDEFMEAVERGADWPLAFPLSAQEATVDGIDLDDPEQVVWREWPSPQTYVTRKDGLVACRIFRRIKAQRIWDMIMTATYDYAEPGFILIDRVNELNNNWFCEEIRATNPCGEQPLPPFGACLLGSVNLTKFVREPFTKRAWFDWEEYRRVVAIFTRMLDNVVEINGLPLERQREEILRKRRHGMGFLGLGSALTMLRMRYGAPDSLAFTERAAKEMALAGWRAGLELAEEKGPAPIMDEEFTLTEALLAKRPEMQKDGYRVGHKVKGRVLWARYSRYMQRIAEADPELIERLAEHGARFTHHSSIAPTGTISLSLANNASNGIEPSFAHHYFRNVIRAGRKSKEKIDVYSFELLAYRQFVDSQALPSTDPQTRNLPDYFVTADDITPQQHVDIQAAAQKWIDSSISKTANVPTDYPYEDFKDIYRYAYQQGLKGCTTFRFNPEAFQGVLVKEQDLANTTYRFRLEDGRVIEVKGGDEIEYDGEVHTAANLYDALKEGYYGKW